MEFVEGESLAGRLRRGKLTAAETMRLVAQAADGLQAVHARGIVHRDIKPANLMIRSDGSVLITDFGISRAEDGTHLTVSGAILGTPTYLSPEQVLGEPATPRSDLYSLGLAAYECLAGHRPFQGDNPYAVALQRVQVAPRTLAGDLPLPVLDLIEKALATDPANRWPTAAAMAAAARAAADRATGSVPGQAVLNQAAPEQAMPERAAALKPRRKRWPLVAAVASVVLLAAGLTVWFTTGRDAQMPVTNGRTAPSGLVTCDALLCPAEPTCWDGLVATAGVAEPPRKVACDGTHRWEVFAAIALPADAVDVRQDELMARPDIAAVCSPAVLTARTAEGRDTTGWTLDAWPVRTPGDGTWILHCIAHPDDPDIAEPSGPAFRAGA